MSFSWDPRHAGRRTRGMRVLLVEDEIKMARAVRRGGPRDRPTVFEVEDVRLDPAGHRVSRSGEEVELSSREFALLESLMRHPGEVLTRRRILEHVWDYNYDGLSNVVDVYVGYLRRKLGTPSNGGEPFIRTVRGVGYVVGP